MSDGLTLDIEATATFHVEYSESEIEKIIEETDIEDREDLIRESETNVREGINRYANDRGLQSVETESEVVEDE